MFGGINGVCDGKNVEPGVHGELKVRSFKTRITENRQSQQTGILKQKCTVTKQYFGINFPNGLKPL